MQMFPLSHLRRLLGSAQVAAVCYRISRGEIEFLLVETRGGRWTFPKGNAEPGLTHAQAAALEAFEEAGVHGRIEETAFTQYVRPKRAGGDVVVSVHLCEVLRTNAPQEAERNPTWFSIERAKKKLRADRRSEAGSQFERVIEQAVARIRKLHSV